MQALAKCEGVYWKLKEKGLRKRRADRIDRPDRRMLCYGDLYVNNAREVAVYSAGRVWMLAKMDESRSLTEVRTPLRSVTLSENECLGDE